MRPQLLACTLAGVSTASFAARTANPSATYALTALYAPTGLTATTAGAGVGLSWTAGQNGSGYAVLGVANGTSSNCAAAATASLGTASGTTYTDAARSTPQGTFFCYEVKTTYASWTSVASNPRVAAQIGVVVSSIVAANGGTAAKLDPGDTITATFNQPITTATGPSGTNSVCAISGATIVIGSTTTSGTCVATETTNFGKLTGGTSSANARFAATYTWNTAHTQLTILVGARSSGPRQPDRRRHLDARSDDDRDQAALDDGQSAHLRHEHGRRQLLADHDRQFLMRRHGGPEGRGSGHAGQPRRSGLRLAGRHPTVSRPRRAVLRRNC